MSVRIILETTVQDWFASESDLAEMTDAEIIELAQEDLSGTFEDAAWTVVRTK